ncbi:MAG TPA: hypothetical protein VIY29_02965 [Ktedonobacteraceae bacterium]
MFFNDFAFWSLALTLCALALLVEAAGLARGFFVERQAIWKSFLLLLPLAVSAWSFFVAISVWNVYNRFPPIGIHFSAGLYHSMKMMIVQAITVCQLQVGIAMAVFVLMLFLERKLRLRYVSLLMLARG